MKVDIGGVSYAVALDWGSKTNISKPTVSYMHVSSGEVHYGVGGRSDDGIPSLAAMCAASEEEGLFVASIDGGRFWSALVIDHSVIDGSDRVFSSTTEFEEYLDQESDATELHFAIAEPMPGFLITNLAALPTDTTDFVLKANKTLKKNAVYMAIIAAVLGFGVASMFLLNAHKEEVKEREKQERIIKEQQRIEQVRLTAINDSSTHSYKAGMSAVLALSKMPLKVHGWEITGASADIDSGMVIIQASNLGGSIDEMKVALSSASNIEDIGFTFLESKSIAEVSFPFRVTLDDHRDDELSGVALFTESFYNFANTAPRGVTIELGAPPTSIEGVGGWTMTTMNIELLNSMMESMNSMPGVGVKAIGLDGTGWSASGVAYAQ